jgi:adenylate cyclase
MVSESKGATANETGRSPSVAPPPGNPFSGRILIVDDDASSREMLATLLRDEGFTSLTLVENGVQAWELLQQAHFDLVLSDIQMPHLDGISLLGQIKRDLHLGNLPVIMISGVDELSTVVKCIGLGAEDYLSKPFNPVILRARIGASLEKKRLRDYEKTHLEQISSQKRRLDRLLNVILPSSAAGELKATGQVRPRRYENVAVLFSDIVNFTDFCDRHDPEDVVSHLQALIERCEILSEKHGMEKIKTIGDSFMAAAGLVRPNQAPLVSAVTCGLNMISAASELKTDVRVGVHCGPVVGGVVGQDKYQFDVWGDTVNVAARMTEVGMPGTVTMTYEDWLQVEADCKGRMIGNVLVKGKGKIQVVEVYRLKESTGMESSHNPRRLDSR